MLLTEQSNEINFEETNKQLLEEIIHYGLSLGADFLEVFLENTDNVSVLVEEDFVTSVSPSFGKGAGIRIFKDKRDGFVSTNDLTKDGLIKSINQALEMLNISNKKNDARFDGLEKLREYNTDKENWLDIIPSINEVSDKL